MAKIHVITYGERWAVKREGTDEPLSTHLTRQRAEVAGRAQARADNVELELHGDES